jgi:hypothetical protein
MVLAKAAGSLVWGRLGGVVGESGSGALGDSAGAATDLGPGAIAEAGSWKGCMTARRHALRPKVCVYSRSAMGMVWTMVWPR